MKFCTRWLLILNVMVGQSLFAKTGKLGNEHANGDPTKDPIEAIPFPEQHDVRELLLEMTKHVPVAANALLDTLDECGAYKHPRDHEDGFYAQTIIKNDDRCFIIYFKKFFVEDLSAVQKRTVTVHEALHHATRPDRFINRDENDVLIQSLSTKIVQKKWDDVARAVKSIKFAPPRRHFHNLPAENIVQALSVNGALQMPKIAREHHANEFDVSLAIVPYYGAFHIRECHSQTLKTIAENIGYVAVLPTTDSLTVDAGRESTKMRFADGTFERDYYKDFIQHMLTDSVRSAVGPLISDYFRGGHYCQFDLYGDPELQEVTGTQTLMLFPKVESTESEEPNKAILLTFFYVHA